MQKVKFKSEPYKIPNLFPEDIYQRIKTDHPVRLVAQIVDQLDLQDIIAMYKGGGTTAFHPKMLIKVIFYAYLSGVYSCRKIAKALEENIHFMWISGGSTPDFRTINNFRSSRLQDKITNLFAQVVKMLNDLGYLRLDTQYIDGTKIEAISNKFTFVWRKTVEKNKAKFEEKLQNVLQDIEIQIQKDTQQINKEELPKPIDSKAIKEKVEALNQQLKQKNNQDKETKKIEKTLEKN